MADGSPRPFAHLSAGEIIRAERTRRGITNAQASAITGISCSHLSNLESGEKTGSDSALEAIAKLLGLDPWELALRGGRAPDAFVEWATKHPTDAANALRRAMENR